MSLWDFRKMTESAFPWWTPFAAVLAAALIYWCFRE